MILDPDYLRNLLDKTLAGLDASADWAVVLEGSIAEGFGNPSSDVDFLLIADGDGELPTMPSVLFVDDRRVEVRTRSVGQLRAQFDEVRTGAQRVADLPEDLLNRCQRVLNSVPLRGEDLVDRVKRLLPARWFATIAAAWWTHHGQQSLRQAVALDWLGEPAEAAGWARAGLVQAVKAWAAGQGETYLEPKWLSMQLDRVDRSEVRDRYWDLDSAGARGPAPVDYVARCVAFAGDLGVTGVDTGPERFAVDRVADVTTWPIADRVHVLRDRRDVFALGDVAGRVWRSLVLGRPLPAVLASAEAVGGPAAGALVARFLRYGLIRLGYDGDPVTPVLPLGAPPGPVTPPPGAARPILFLGGAAVSGPQAVDLVPMPADRFSAAAMNLVWSNVLIENVREDLSGAVRREQWAVAELAARRTAQVALRGLLSAFGVNPLPPDSDVVRRLDLLPADRAGIGEVIMPLARKLDTSAMASHAQSEAVLSDLNRFVAEVRAVTGADAFPSSFTSAGQWRATLDIGYDWLRLGAYLDAALPIDEARDLLSSGGAQPHPRHPSR